MRGGRGYVDHIGEVPLFRACSKKHLSTIARTVDEVTIPAGKEFIKEGDRGRELFVIVDGTAVVKRNNRKVATLGPGAYVGELALLDRGPRNASVIAETDLDVIVLGQREFGGLVDEVPGLAHKILETMAHRLREADARDPGH